MISSLDRSDVAVRLSGYVAELQLFFQKHDLPTGSISDLVMGTRRLSLGGTLADELSAAIRSIVYREHEEVTEHELTELLVASLAGGSIQQDSAELAEPKRRLQDFLATALRSFTRSTPEAPYRSRLSKGPRNAAQRPASEPIHATADADSAATENSEGMEPPVRLPEFSAVIPAAESSTLRSKDVAQHSGLPTLQEFVEPESLNDPNMASNQDAVAREVARMMAQDQALRGTRPLEEPATKGPARVIEEVRLVGEQQSDRIAPRSQQGRPTAWPAVPTRDAKSISEPVLATRSVGFIQGVRDSRSAETSRRMRDEPSMGMDAHRTGSEATTKDEDGVFPEYRTLAFIRPEHRTLWIVGICCLLLGLAAGWLASGHHLNHDRPVVDPEGAPASTSQLKPSPYTLASPVTAPATALSHVVRDSRSAVSTAGNEAQPADVADAAGKLPVRVEGRNTAQAPTERYTSQPVADLATDIRTAASDSETGSLSSPEGVAGGSSSPVGSVYLSAAGAMASNLVAAPAPLYPAQASAAGVQGRVVVQALVGRDGHVLDAHVTSGDRLLREAALEAVTRWKYRPFVEDGRPAEVETVAILDFRLAQ